MERREARVRSLMLNECLNLANPNLIETDGIKRDLSQLKGFHVRLLLPGTIAGVLVLTFFFCFILLCKSLL